jgi:hypothetical protein
MPPRAAMALDHPKLIARIRELRVGDPHISDRRMADELGISQRSVVRIRLEAGIQRPKPAPPREPRKAVTARGDEFVVHVEGLPNLRRADLPPQPLTRDGLFEWLQTHGRGEALSLRLLIREKKVKTAGGIGGIARDDATLNLFRHTG